MAQSVPARWRELRQEDAEGGLRRSMDDLRGRIGLNFLRPDANRPGHHAFAHDGAWLVSQYRELGVKWNRLAFSCVAI